MKDYAFIDLHIHTKYSDEELCNTKIKDILQETQERAEKAGKDAVISITDHNSILGVIEARRLLNKVDENGKLLYPNVKFVNGIEITTDLKEMAKLYGNKKVFNRCHTLAYGYNENDEELIAYSKITHYFFSRNDNIGMQICAARRKVNEAFRTNIPFKTYLEMVSLPKNAKFKQEFINITTNYLINECQIMPKPDALNKIVSDYISNNLDMLRTATAEGRLLLSEVATIVNNAGGELVLAHPSLINLTSNGLDIISEKYQIAKENIFKDTNVVVGAVRFGFLDNKKLVLNEFIDSFEKVAKTKLSGLEKFYSTNFHSKMYSVIEDICKERNLYTTAGSDNHGEILSKDGAIGKILPRKINEYYKEIFDNENTELYPLHLTSLASVEHLLEKSVTVDKNDYVFSSTNEIPLTSEDFELLCNISRGKKLDMNEKKKVENKRREQKKDYLKERLEELKNITEILNKAILFKYDRKNQAKIMVELNLYAEKILNKINVMINYNNQNLELIHTSEYNEFYDIYNNFVRKYKSLIKNNKRLLLDLQSDMSYYFEKDIVLNCFTNFKLIEPIIMLDRSAKNKTALTCSNETLNQESDQSLER